MTELHTQTFLSLNAKLLRGASVNIVEHGLKVVVMFITTPLMVQFLGKEDYGIWLLSIAIIAYVRLLDLGVSLSGSRFLANSLGSGDEKEYRSLICRLFRLYSWIGIAAICVAAMVVFSLPYFFTDAEFNGTLQILVAGFGITLSLRFFTRIYEVILKSHVRYDFIGISSILKTILQGGLVIGLLLSGFGLVPLLIAHILVDVFDQLLLLFFARKVEADLRLTGFDDGKVTTGELIRYSSTVMVTTVGRSLRQGIDPFIIAGVSGLASLPLYSVGTRFLGVFTDLVNSVFGGNFVSAFSQLKGRGETNALNERFLRAIRYSTVIATLAGCGLMIFGSAFITRWVGADFGESGMVLWILTPVTTLFLCQYPVLSIFYSLNKHHWLAVFTFTAGVFNLVLSFYLGWRIGWIGVVWGTCVEMLIAYGLVMPWMVKRVCSVPLRDYWLEIAKPGVKIILAAVVFWLVTHHWIQPTYLHLLAFAFGYLITISTAVWFMVFINEERVQVGDVAKRLLERIPTRRVR